MNQETTTHRKESISTLKCMVINGPYQTVEIESRYGSKVYIIKPEDIERAKQTIEHLEGLI